MKADPYSLHEVRSVKVEPREDGPVVRFLCSLTWADIAKGVVSLFIALVVGYLVIGLWSMAEVSEGNFFPDPSVFHKPWKFLLH